MSKLFEKANRLSAMAHRLSMEAKESDNMEAHEKAGLAHENAMLSHLHLATRYMNKGKYGLALRHGVISMKHGHAFENHMDFDMPDSYHMTSSDTIEEKYPPYPQRSEAQERAQSSIGDFAPMQGVDKKSLLKRAREQSIAAGYHSSYIGKNPYVKRLIKLHKMASRILKEKAKRLE